MNQLSQKVLAELTSRQKSDLLFLGSGLFAGIDLKTRQAILQHLKENGGKITYDNLVDLGVYEPGTLAEGGFERWFQDLDMGGGPAHFADLLAKEYTLSDFETSFAKLDQEQRRQRGAEMTMLFAMTAAPIINRVFYGPAGISLDPNRRLESIEQQGWSIKGSQSLVKPPEDVGNPGGSTVGAWEYSGKPYSGTRNPDADFINKRGSSTLKTHFDDHASEFSFSTEDEYSLGARNFLEKQPTPTTQSFLTKDGTYFRFDTETNEFGIMNKYGGISTYFKPDRGMDYWLEQIRLYAPKIGKEGIE